MKIAVVADLHFGMRNDSTVFSNYALKFIREVFLPKLDEEKITTVLSLGDLFDRRKYCNILTLKIWREEFFEQLAKRKISFHTIIGNHDAYFRNSNSVTSVRELISHYPNFHIYSETQTINLEGLDILVVPWINESNMEDTWTMIQNSKARMLAGHLEVQGFERHKGHANKDDGFEMDDLNHFELVISGHYHYPSRNGNIFYLGSPFEMISSDGDTNRGIYLLDPKTLSTTLIPNPYRVFEKVYYDDSKVSTKEILAQDFSHLEGCYVSVMVQSKTKIDTFAQFIKLIGDANPVQVTVYDGFQELNTSEIDEEIIKKDTLSVLLDSIPELVEGREDIEDLSEFMRDLYQLANQVGDNE